MKKKVYRPFWSYDAEKTEAWLDTMAERGYELTRLNRVTRSFSFEKVESKPRRHRVVYNEKQSHVLSRTLQDDGWFVAVQSGNWAIVCNEEGNQPKYYPVRDGIMKRNRKVWTIHQLLAIFLIAYIAGIAFTTGFSPGDIEPSPFWSITIAAAMFIGGQICVSLYSLVKINRTIKSIGNDGVPFSSGTIHKQDGKVIVKRKIGWIYAPDLLENWLEDMERHGFQLVRVGKFGMTFYFTEGEARPIAYSVDYQHLTDENYFRIHRDAGWQHVYTSWDPVQKWVIWSQEMHEGEERPLIYDDSENLLKYAKRVFKTNLAICIFLIFTYIFNLTLNFMSIMNGSGGISSLFALLIMMVGMIVFVLLSVRSSRYYKRMQGKAELL